MAQEVEKIVPEVVATSPAGYKAVYYAKLLPLQLESIKGQQAMIQKQQDEITVLKQQQKQLAKKESKRNCFPELKY